MKKTAEIILICVCFFLLLEAGARLWPGSQGNNLEKARVVLKADTWLGWRQRENLRGVRFMGFDVNTNEIGLRDVSISQIPSEARRVLVLGPSSAFGWGVREEDTYSRRLEKSFEPQANIRVINAGEIGFSTFQGLRLLHDAEIHAIHPCWIVVAYGVNDLDRERFFFQSEHPDSEELKLAEPPLKTWFYQAASSTASLRLLFSLANTIRERLGLNMPLRGGTIPPLRVSPAEFEENLLHFKSIADRMGARLVFVNTPTSLPVPEAGAADRSEENYQKALSEENLGHPRAAREAYESARAYEPARIWRDIGRYNEVMNRVGLQKGVPVVDAAGLISGRAEYFVDPIHPSPEGHARIAEALKRVIAK